MSGVCFFNTCPRSSLFVSSRKTNHVLHIPSMQWINTLILCCWSAHSLTYYCIRKRLWSETGHAKAGSYHMKPRNGGGGELEKTSPEWLCRLHVTKKKYCTYTNVWTKELFLLVMCRILWREARAGNSRWVGKEGEGLCLQMLIAWMLNLHRNV